RFAGSIHQILESKACRRVNRSIREPSAGNLMLPHRMADHIIDIDAVEDPVQLLGRKRDHRCLPARPPEPVLGQPLQDQHKARPMEEQELHPVATATQKPPVQTDRAPSSLAPEPQGC
ncbi:hypothetical protein NKH76_35465, partial [Mesorhizobium sp. M0965]